MRKLIHVFVISFIFFLVGGAYYVGELQYASKVKISSSKVSEPLNMKALDELAQEKALFLHFYNRMCPCSRFNEDHFFSLTKRFADSVQFVVVINPRDVKSEVNAYYNEDFGNLPYIIDSGKTLATRFGVQATPHAVLIDKSKRVSYSGPYNSSAFCSRPSTAFAKLSLEALLSNNQAPQFSNVSGSGCELGKLSLTHQLKHLVFNDL